MDALARTYGMPVFKSTGNSAGPSRISRRVGDNFAAYDSLPALVREALQLAVQDWCPHEVRAFYLPVARLVPTDQGDLAAELYVEAFRQAEEAEVRKHSELYQRFHQTPSPHVAAGATVLRAGSRRPRRPSGRAGRRLWA